MRVLVASTLCLADWPDSFVARKRPVQVDVQFATADGRLETREGTVSYRAGDALLTAATGESWPVAHARFLETYDSVAPTQPGQAGRYVKRALPVRALRAADIFACTYVEQGED
jgi:hypothetical protein